MRRYVTHALVSLTCLGSVNAAEETFPSLKPSQEPWFTGTLLAPLASSTPAGYIDVEPFLLATQSYGQYDAEWKAHEIPKELSVSPLLFLTVGLVDGLDFQISPALLYTRTQGISATRFTDLPLGFDLQLYTEKKENFWPSVKISLIEIFPTGKYQKLNPKKLGTDISGAGSFVTVAEIVFSRVFHIYRQHYLHTYLSFEYFIPTDVHVKGFNAYGGGFGTRGKVHPGTIYTALFSFEYSLTRNWVFAFDFVNIYRNKNHFSGKKGRLANGTPATVGDPSANQISLAPALEYNFSESFGIIGGAWFSVAGRNSSEFAGGIIALNWYLNIQKKEKK